MAPEPEKEARETIDKLLAQAGWLVCDASQANIHAARGRGGSDEGSVNLRPAERVATAIKNLEQSLKANRHPAMICLQTGIDWLYGLNTKPIN